MKDLWINKRWLSVQDILDLVEKGDILTDNQYKIPDGLTGLENKYLFVLSEFDLLSIYCVQDNTGRLHANSSDIEHLKCFAKKGIDDSAGRRLLQRTKVLVVFIDYRTPENIRHTFWSSVWGQKRISEQQFKDYVLQELDAAGYFIRDCDSEVMKINDPDWKPYSSKTFGQMLMDFACQWNMEHEGKDYRYVLNGTC